MSSFQKIKSGLITLYKICCDGVTLYRIGDKGTTKFAGVQEKLHFFVIFCSERYRRARLLRGTQGYSACTLSGKTITEIPEYDSGLMDKDCIEYSTTSQGNRRIFTRRTIASALDRWQGTGKVLDGNGVVTKWFRSGNEKGSRKKHDRQRQEVHTRLLR